MASNLVDVSAGLDDGSDQGTRSGGDGTGSDLLLREAEHRHGNTLQILSSLVRRTLREADSPEVREVLSALNELIDTLVGLHKLGQDREDDPAALLLGMVPHWQRLCNGHIRIEVEAEPGLEMSQSSRTVAIMIAQELVLGAIRHAFPDHQCGLIRVRLFATDGDTPGGDTTEGGRATLEVEDNGAGPSPFDGPTGAPPAPPHPRAHAHALVQDLAEALGGTLRAHPAATRPGHRLSVSWPL